MALSFTKMHSDKLEQEFKKKPEKDVMPAKRKQIGEGIDRTLAQLKDGEVNPKRGWYKSKDGAEGIRTTLKLGNKTMTVDGRDHWFVDDATAFYKAAKEDLEAGKLDEAIKATMENSGSKSAGRAPSSTRSEAMKAAWARKKAEAKKK